MSGEDALADLKVIDLTRVRAGPSCVRVFADWGADVIRVEQRGDGEDGFGPRAGADFQNLHRNKRSVTIDLKQARGVAVLKRLVANADILVENYRPAVKARLGIDYDTLAAVNPRLIYASISGFGETGPYRDHAGFDQVAQGMGGLMWTTGLPGQGPLRAGTPIADLSAGLHAALGILVALRERARSGRGQWVQTSLLASMVAMMDFQAARYLVDGEVPGQAGNDHPTSMPTSVYPCQDGHINIAASGDAIYARLCAALGAESLAEEAEFATSALRSLNRVALNARIAALTATRPMRELMAALHSAGVPCGPIYKMDEVFDDPQVRHLGMATPVPRGDGDSVTLVGPPFSLSRTPPRMRHTLAAAGGDNLAVLREHGFGDDEIAALARDAII
jgi:crotonobetainyl-CoA:carnitine CoA-transferase CaiB-like acyl-CoA transferase